MRSGRSSPSSKSCRKSPKAITGPGRPPQSKRVPPPLLSNSSPLILPGRLSPVHVGGCRDRCACEYRQHCPIAVTKIGGDADNKETHHINRCRPAYPQNEGTFARAASPPAETAQDDTSHQPRTDAKQRRRLKRIVNRHQGGEGRAIR